MTATYTLPAPAPVVPGRHRLAYQPRQTVPVLALLLMAAAGFITMMTEALPVGVTPALRADTGWDDATIGQLVTAYAVGCGLSAIPMALLTRSWNRKVLLLATLAAFVVTNTVTMLTTSLLVITAARFCAGTCAGLMWAMLAGYATRLVVPEIAGKAMAIAMAGTPVALALGIPFGSFLGMSLGWRLTFVAVSALAAVVLVLAAMVLPSVEGEPATGGRPGVLSVLRLPGLAVVLLVTAAFSTAHNTIYTFLPALSSGRDDLRLDLLLLAFGAFAVVGLTVVGKKVDGHMQELTRITCLALVVMLAATRLVPTASVPVVWLVVGLWGAVFGGAPTLFQTASARICGQSQEIGQALVVTTWNLCVAVAGALGGVIVHSGRTESLPWVGALIALVAAAATLGRTLVPVPRRAPRHARNARNAGTD